MSLPFFGCLMRVCVQTDALPDTLVVVGGAPLTQGFCDKIGADGYAPDPEGVIEYLDATMAN